MKGGYLLIINLYKSILETLKLKIVSIVLARYLEKRFGFKGTYNNTSRSAFLPVRYKERHNG